MSAASNPAARVTSMPCSIYMTAQNSKLAKGKTLHDGRQQEIFIPTTTPCFAYHAYGKGTRIENGLKQYKTTFVVAEVAEIIGGTDTFAPAYRASHCREEVATGRGLDNNWKIQDAHDPEYERLASMVLHKECGCVNFDIVTLVQKVCYAQDAANQ
jgi:hypothetical protein